MKKILLFFTLTYSMYAADISPDASFKVLEVTKTTDKDSVLTGVLIVVQCSKNGVDGIFRYQLTSDEISTFKGDEKSAVKAATEKAVLKAQAVADELVVVPTIASYTKDQTDAISVDKDGKATVNDPKPPPPPPDPSTINTSAVIE